MRMLALIGAALALVPAAAAYKNPTPGRAVVVQIAGMHRAKVTHRRGLGVYRPRAGRRRLPAVLIGGKPRSARSIGWAQLVSASGMAAVTSGDLGSASAYVRAHAAGLGIDASRLCTLSFRATTVPEARPGLRCSVAYYGALEADPAQTPPMLVVKAGRDTPTVNQSIDNFAALALQRHADVRVIENTGARAGFDVGPRTGRSKTIVRETLRFLEARLAKPLAVDRCATAAERASALRFFASDDTQLVGVVVGRGPAGIVAAHNSGGDLCQWLPDARRLAALGYRVFAYDSRAGIRVDLDMEAAVEALRRVGADRVAAVGSSLGGLAAILGSSRLSTQPDAVISLSAPGSYGPLHALSAVPTLHVPILFAAAEDDHPFVDDARALFAAASSPNRRLEVVPGAAHGTDLLQDGAFKSLFEGYLAQHLLR